MVVAHVLCERHEFDVMAFGYFLKYLETKIRLVAIHAMEEFRLVIEGVEMRLDAKQRARKPEETFEGHPKGDVAVVMFLFITVVHVPSNGVGVVERFIIMVLEIFLHGRKDGSAEGLWLGQRACARAKPLLNKGIQSKVLLGFDTVHAGREAFSEPTFDGEVPPAGPFDAGEAVSMLEIQHCFDSFADVHGKTLPEKV